MAGLFNDVRGQVGWRRLQGHFDDSYAERERVRTGIALTTNAVAVNGHSYRLTNGRDMNLLRNEEVEVVNHGRAAAARYGLYRPVKRELPPPQKNELRLMVLGQSGSDPQVAVPAINQIFMANSTIEAKGRGAVLVTPAGGEGGSITVKEADNSPSVEAASTLIFPNGSLTDNGGGSVTYKGLTVTEIDTLPEVTGVAKLVFPNTLVTDNNDGSVTIKGLTVTESDNLPLVENVTKIKFSPGSVTDNADGSVTVSNGGGQQAFFQMMPDGTLPTFIPPGPRNISGGNRKITTVGIYSYGRCSGTFMGKSFTHTGEATDNWTLYENQNINWADGADLSMTLSSVSLDCLCINGNVWADPPVVAA